MCSHNQLNIAIIVKWMLTNTVYAYQQRLLFYDIYDRVPVLEWYHDPHTYTTERSRYVNGTLFKTGDPRFTPDFRIEESPYFRYYDGFFREEERPYRVSPHYKQTSRWTWREHARNIGCLCTTVFRRTRLLAGCAVLTNRHILTTATPTELILRKRRHFKHFENILGVWYDHNHNYFNSSMYGTPARIHYHPKYIRPTEVNRTHPMPCAYDLSLWTMTHRLYGGSSATGGVANTRFTTWGYPVKCPRATSNWGSHYSPMASRDELAIIVGFQFIRAYRRVPMPWYKYAVRTRKHIRPCPKTEWTWFNCISGGWAKLGLDSGAGLLRAMEGRRWRNDGLAGLNSISMKLRSLDLVHYFTVLDTHEVITFLYDSYMGILPWEFLDFRFQDTKYWTLEPKHPKLIYWDWTWPDQSIASSYHHLPNY